MMMMMMIKRVMDVKSTLIDRGLERSSSLRNDYCVCECEAYSLRKSEVGASDDGTPPTNHAYASWCTSTPPGGKASHKLLHAFIEFRHADASVSQKRGQPPLVNSASVPDPVSCHS